jgi:hypothetical protein
MNIQDLIEDLLSELSYQSPTGVPDLKDRKTIGQIYEFFNSNGLGEVGQQFINNLLSEAPNQPLSQEKKFKNPQLNKVVQYKDNEGKDKEGLVGNLLRLGTDQPGREAAERALSGLSDEERENLNKELGDEGGGGEDTPQPTSQGGDQQQTQQGTALNPDTEAGKSFTDQLSPSDVAYTGDENETEKEETEEVTPFKQPSTSTISNKTQRLEKARNIVMEGDYNDATKNAYEIFEREYNKILNATTKEEQLEGLEVLVENGFIERNGNGKKMYVSNLPLGHKHISDGDSFSEYLNKVAEENRIDVPYRNSSKDRALADTSGKHNEAGVVAILDPSETNKNEYDRYREEYSEFGGNESDAHKQNEQAALEIQKEVEKVFPGGKIKSAKQVGGVGETELKKLGIDPKVDPTDVIIEVETPNGTTQIMKVSMKVYSNPKDITMKNSGVGKAGADYLGFEEIDNQWQEMRDRNDWREPGISDQEQGERKRKFREEYLTMFSNKMVELSKSEEGQEKLLQMWKDVHGCGNNVYTSVTNKKTGETKVYSPDHYCEPETPFQVEYDGTKVVIKMNTRSDAYMQIDCKTETTSSPKLLFKHKKK